MPVIRSAFPPAALGLLLAAGCSAPEAPTEEGILEEAGASSGEAAPPEPVHMELDPRENTVELSEGLTYTLSDLDRAVSSWDDTPYLAFDVTVANSTGQAFDPAGVNLWVSAGPQGAEAEQVVDPENGVGIEDGHGAASGPEFGAMIPDGEEATLRFGYSLAPEEEKVEIRLQPWDVEGAAEVYLAGEVPQ